MQDQGKRLMIAVVLALGVMLVYSNLFQNDEPPATTTTPSPGVAASSREKPLPIGPPAGGEAPGPAGEVLTLTFDNLVARFSSSCGGLVSWQLTDARYARDASKGQLLPERDRMALRDASGKSIGVPAAQLANVPECGAFEVNFMAPAPSSTSSTFFVPRHAAWKGEQVSSTEVRYSYVSEQLEVVKDFKLMPDKYLVRLTVRVTARPPEGSTARQELAVSAYAFQDPAELETGFGQSTPRAWASATLRDGELLATDVAGVSTATRWEWPVQWTGFEHPYLLVGYAPLVRGGESVWKQTSVLEGVGVPPTSLMRTDLVFPEATFKRGDPPVTREVVAYLGPKNYDYLHQTDAVAGFATGFSHVVDLGWFAFIGRPLLWLLQRFHQAFGNWGIAIILLTFLVKGLTLYWTTKSMRSMKAMASLAPQMKALQGKYADDKQRQQQETMALYKEHGVNPVAGCLPILLQMPIWLALYRMLSSAGELYQQAFIPGWIDDLTATDPFHILPVVLVVTMFVQARLQPANADSTQQKFLQYGMPLMFGVMSFFFPAGLTLYIFTNTVLSALHSIYMNKFDKPSLAMAEQLKKNQETAAAVVAKGANGTKATGAAQPKAKIPAAKVKRVIEVEASETSADGASAAGDGDDPTDALDAGSTAGAAGSRPRRKKRRR
jgi:YidC/Oxa1 family membrane protein insertase